MEPGLQLSPIADDDSEDLSEAAAIYRLNFWQRFSRVELPFGTIPLVWNSMMSWAGGWFFLMAAEQLTLGKQSFQLPGLGSYLQVAANRGNTVELVQGDVILTPEGRRFAEAGIVERKRIFRRQAIANVEILQKIVTELDAAPEHQIKEHQLLDELEQTFSPVEARRKLDTAIRWGRYANLFTYDDERGEFRAAAPKR